MKKIVLEYSEQLKLFLDENDFTYRYSLHNGIAFIIIEFEYSQDSFHIFELGVEFGKYISK